jgi:hypothetical protein
MSGAGSCTPQEPAAGTIRYNPPMNANANNRIDARIEFSFKGEHHNVTATIDLDALLLEEDVLPDFHRLLAQANGIDTYSYLYEVMETCDIDFGNARGLAAACLHDGVFDVAGYRRLRQAQHETAILAPIAQRHLNIDDLDSHPALRQALLEAYRAGKSAGH